MYMNSVPRRVVLCLTCRMSVVKYGVELNELQSSSPFPGGIVMKQMMWSRIPNMCECDMIEKVIRDQAEWRCTILSLCS